MEDGKPVETRLDLEDIGEREEEDEEEDEDEEEEGYPLWASGGFPRQRGASEEQVEVEMEEMGGQEEEEEDGETRPLVPDRDPKGINKCLKVTFEDVIAEPPSVRSFDRVWLWSHALFEVSRLWSYRLVSLLLAVPVALLAGVLFAILSCLHIWLIMPCLQLCLINMQRVQTVWGSVLDVVVGPFFRSAGRCCAGISVRLARD